MPIANKPIRPLGFYHLFGEMTFRGCVFVSNRTAVSSEWPFVAFISIRSVIQLFISNSWGNVNEQLFHTVLMPFIRSYHIL